MRLFFSPFFDSPKFLEGRRDTQYRSGPDTCPMTHWRRRKMANLCGDVRWIWVFTAIPAVQRCPSNRGGREGFQLLLIGANVTFKWCRNHTQKFAEINTHINAENDAKGRFFGCRLHLCPDLCCQYHRRTPDPDTLDDSLHRGERGGEIKRQKGRCRHVFALSNTKKWPLLFLFLL